MHNCFSGDASEDGEWNLRRFQHFIHVQHTDFQKSPLEKSQHFLATFS